MKAKPKAATLFGDSKLEAERSALAKLRATPEYKQYLSDWRERCSILNTADVRAIEMGHRHIHLF